LHVSILVAKVFANVETIEESYGTSYTLKIKLTTEFLRVFMWIKQLTLLKDASVFIDVCKLRGGACEKKKTGTRIGFSFLSGVPVREKRDVAKIGEYRW